MKMLRKTILKSDKQLVFSDVITQTHFVLIILTYHMFSMQCLQKH